MAQGRELEIAAAEQIGVGPEEGDRVDARANSSASATRLTTSASAENFTATQAASPSGIAAGRRRIKLDLDMVARGRRRRSPRRETRPA